MKKVIILINIGLILSGCATAYQPKGFIGNGGFEDIELEPGYYRVTFKGNEKTSKERANDFALLRASELFESKGCNSFKVIKSNNEINSGSVFIPQTQYTTANLTNYGSTAIGSAHSTTYGGGLINLHFPKTTLEAKCTEEKPDVQNGIYSTQFIKNAIRSKYKINDK